MCEPTQEVIVAELRLRGMVQVADILTSKFSIRIYSNLITAPYYTPSKGLKRAEIKKGHTLHGQAEHTPSSLVSYACGNLNTESGPKGSS